jgi:opacity protein-like surface antigen
MSTLRSLLVVSLAAACSGSVARADFYADDPRWQVSVAALQVSADPYLPGTGYDDAGAELGLSYRLSDRVGLGLTAIDVEVEDHFGLDFFGPLFGFETRYRSTWLMARADFHLTPEQRVDLILSPMVGYQRTRDIEERVTLDFFGAEEFTVPFESDENLAMGARLAMDIPLSRTPGRSSLTVGLTYLYSQIETVSRAGIAPEETLEFDLEPVALHVGYVFRF